MGKKEFVKDLSNQEPVHNLLRDDDTSFQVRYVLEMYGHFSGINRKVITNLHVLRNTNVVIFAEYLLVFGG
jgi:hypothetical protein